MIVQQLVIGEPAGHGRIEQHFSRFCWPADSVHDGANSVTTITIKAFGLRNPSNMVPACALNVLGSAARAMEWRPCQVKPAKHVVPCCIRSPLVRDGSLWNLNACLSPIEQRTELAPTDAGICRWLAQNTFVHF